MNFWFDYKCEKRKDDPLQKVLGQFFGIVGMALARYDLQTKPTNIGMFCLGFLGICRQNITSGKDCWQY